MSLKIQKIQEEDEMRKVIEKKKVVRFKIDEKIEQQDVINVQESILSDGVRCNFQCRMIKVLSAPCADRRCSLIDFNTLECLI